MKIKTIQQHFKKDYQETNDWKVTYQRFLENIQKKEENETIPFSGLVKEITLPLFLHFLIIEKIPMREFKNALKELYQEKDAHLILKHCFNIEMSYELDEIFLPRLQYAKDEERQEIIHVMLSMSNTFSDDDGEIIQKNSHYLQACLELIPENNPSIFFNSKIISFMSQFTTSEKINKVLHIFSSIEKNSVFKKRRDVSDLNFWEGFINNLITDIIEDPEEIRKVTNIFLDKNQFETNLISLMENLNISENLFVVFCSHANINFFIGLEKRWAKSLKENLSRTQPSEPYYYNKIYVWMYKINDFLEKYLNFTLDEQKINYSRWSFTGNVMENMPQLILFHYAIKNGYFPELSESQLKNLEKLISDYIKNDQLNEATSDCLNARLIQSYLQTKNLNNILSCPQDIIQKHKI